MDNLRQGIIEIDGKEYLHSPVLTYADNSLIYSSYRYTPDQYHYHPFHAFEEPTLDSVTAWHTDFNGVSEWIGYDYQKPITKIGVALIYPSYSTYGGILDFQIQYFADGQWKNIVEENLTLTEVQALVGQTKVYWFDQPITAEKFRYHATKLSDNYVDASLYRLRFIDVGNNIVENYCTEDGTELKPSKVTTKKTDGIYISVAPKIDGYTCKGYKSKNLLQYYGGLQDEANDYVVFRIQQTPTTITFIYEQNDLITKPSSLELDIALATNESIRLLEYFADVSSLQWLSENESIASISSNNYVRGEKPGFTKIHAYRYNNLVGTIGIEVVSKRKVPICMIMRPNELRYLKQRFTPENALEPIVFESNDNKVAIVDPDGVVIAIAEGRTFVSVKTLDGRLVDFIHIQVKN